MHLNLEGWNKAQELKLVNSYPMIEFECRTMWFTVAHGPTQRRTKASNQALHVHGRDCPGAVVEFLEDICVLQCVGAHHTTHIDPREHEGRGWHK